MVYQDKGRIDIEQRTQTYDERWFCVQIQPNKELFAAQNLERQTYRYFLPIVLSETSAYVFEMDIRNGCLSSFASSC